MKKHSMPLAIKVVIFLNLFYCTVLCDERKLPLDRKVFTWGDQGLEYSNFKQIDALRRNGKTRKLYPDSLSIKKALQAGNDS